MTSFNPTFDSPWDAGYGKARGGRKHKHRGWQAMMAAQHRGGPGRFGGRGDVFFGGPGFGPFGPSGPFGGRGGRRARRGDVRLAALLLIAEEPRNGYAIMQELEQRSDGLWRPSPGSVYPALSQLEDEGLIRSREVDGGRVFELTDAGRAHVAERPADAPAPWDTVGQGMPEGTRAVFGHLKPLAVAVAQVAQAGTPEQAEQAAEILDQARRSIYRILADGDVEPADA